MTSNGRSTRLLLLNCWIFILANAPTSISGQSYAQYGYGYKEVKKVSLSAFPWLGCKNEKVLVSYSYTKEVDLQPIRQQ